MLLVQNKFDVEFERLRYCGCIYLYLHKHTQHYFYNEYHLNNTFQFSQSKVYL
jgi:hypothetical protein